MRLTVLERGHRLPARLFISTVSRLSRVEMADVPKTLLYRPEFAGRALLDLSADAMRGPSYWSAGEREYLGMSIAKVLRCPYCAVTHEELVRIASDGDLDPTDPAAGRPELHAIRRFVEQVTLGAELERPAVPHDAVVEALRVALVWNVVNRLANAFDFQLRPGQLEKGTRSLHRFGYKFPSFLTGRGPSGGRDGLVDRLRYAVLEAPAGTEPAVRSAAATGGALPEPVAAYAATVRDRSYRVTDGDFERLAEAGYSQDAIYEITVAAAVGAALRVYDTASPNPSATDVS